MHNTFDLLGPVEMLLSIILDEYRVYFIKQMFSHSRYF